MKALTIKQPSQHSLIIGHQDWAAKPTQQFCKNVSLPNFTDAMYQDHDHHRQTSLDFDLGITETRESRPRIRPLLVPDYYEDFTCPVAEFSKKTLETRRKTAPAARICFIASEVRSLHRSDTYDQIYGEFVDSAGNAVMFTANGKAMPLLRYFDSRKGLSLRFSAYIQRRRGRFALLDPEPLEDKDFARVRGVYPLHQATITRARRATEGDKHSYLAERIAQNIIREALAEAYESYETDSWSCLRTLGLKNRKAFIAAMGTSKPTQCRGMLKELLRQAHHPVDMDAANDAINRIDLIAGVSLLNEAIERSFRASIRGKGKPSSENALVFNRKLIKGRIDAYIRELSSRFGFTLTASQTAACRDILKDFIKGHPTRRLLAGDVGTGKTFVLAIAMMAAAQSGWTVAMLNPTELLAIQSYQTLKRLFPDEPIALLAGPVRTIPEGARIHVGTLALLHHDPDVQYSLMVTDEQHRFGKAQREELSSERGFILEASATPIPRSTALTLINSIELSTLTESHVKKTIKTRIHEADQWESLLAEVRHTVSQGQQVLVVYPARDSNEEIYSVAEDRALWHGAFPGRVATMHGNQSSEENTDAITAVRENRVDVVLATTIIEVGIDLPGLRRVVVVQPERFGLSSLHQIRGRIARTGGLGHCNLWVRRDITPKARDRLEFFAKTSRGYTIAEYDLEVRGGGDLEPLGHRQSGAMPESPFPSRVVPLHALDAASTALKAVYGLGEA